MIQWVVEGQLARSHRPGYRPGPEFRVSRDQVDGWVAAAQAAGIQSIICLLDRDQLHLYDALPGGLTGYYEAAGFAVGHVPTFDGQTEPFSPRHYDEIWLAFQRLPRPVLVHCSAGYDRTGRAVQHILAMAERGG